MTPWVFAKHTPILPGAYRHCTPASTQVSTGPAVGSLISGHPAKKSTPQTRPRTRVLGRRLYRLWISIRIMVSGVKQSCSVISINLAREMNLQLAGAIQFAQLILDLVDLALDALGVGAVLGGATGEKGVAIHI